MTDTPEAVRLADWLQAAVQTYPQVSADEPGGYCSEMDQMIDQAAALLRRIPEIEAERDQLRAWQQAAFAAHPNIDIDIEAITPPNANQKGQ